MSTRQRRLLAIALCYGAALITVAIVRMIPSAPPLLQWVTAAAVGLAVGALVSWRLGVLEVGRRASGRYRVINTATMAIALIAILILGQALPDAWPVFAIGLVLPILLVGALVFEEAAGNTHPAR